MSEFAFWPSSPPRHNGGVYELRSYQLIPGRFLEWENAWKRGLEARKRFVVSAIIFVLCKEVSSQALLWSVSSNQQEVGLPKSERCMKFIICGRLVRPVRQSISRERERMMCI